jgi:hypothetical protein
MPPIHHQRLAEAVEVGFRWDLVCFCLLVGFRFLLVRLLFLDIGTPFLSWVKSAWL